MRPWPSSRHRRSRGRVLPFVPRTVEPADPSWLDDFAIDIEQSDTAIEITISPSGDESWDLVTVDEPEGVLLRAERAAADVPAKLRRRSDRLLDRTAREWGEDGKASGPAGPYDSGV
jgi:hypothetical protein